MKNNIFKIIISFFIIISLFSSLFLLNTSAYTTTDFELYAESALLVNTDTNFVLYQKNPDKKMYPASLTKLMTALIMYENTSDIDNETVTVSEYAIKSLNGTDTVTRFKVGETVTVRQLLNVFLIASANDGANAIAEKLSGSIEAFVELMNKRAAELGMVNTHFMNPHGLHDDNHYTTANDLLILTKKCLEIPFFKEIFKTNRYKMEATNKSTATYHTNTNFLLNPNEPKYFYKYATGIKTGYTDKAGRCLISSAEKNGYEYISIVLNCPVYQNGKKVRLEFTDTKNLFEWAFNDFQYKQIVAAGEIIGEAPVEIAKDVDHVALTSIEDFSTIVPKNSDSSTISYNIRLNSESFDAPIKKNEILGVADVVFAGEVIGSINLVAAQDVEKSFISQIMRATYNVFSSDVFKILLVLAGIFILVFVIICIKMNSKKKKDNRP